MPTTPNKLYEKAIRAYTLIREDNILGYSPPQLQARIKRILEDEQRMLSYLKDGSARFTKRDNEYLLNATVSTREEAYRFLAALVKRTKYVQSVDPRIPPQISSQWDTSDGSWILALLLVALCLFNS